MDKAFFGGLQRAPMPSPVANGQLGQAADNAAGRPSQVAEACIGIEARISDLETRLEALEKRLYPVLRSRPPEPAQDQAKSLEPVQLAAALHVYGERVKGCSETVASLLDRIEL